MIQRKQTIFLLLALAALIVCLCLPIGKLTGNALGATASVYNIGIFVQGKLAAHPLLFVDLVIVASLTLIDIFLYNKRKLQIGICLANIVLCLAWYAYYAFMALSGPLVAIVLFILARSGIKADENLLKSMDRIR